MVLTNSSESLELSQSGAVRLEALEIFPHEMKSSLSLERALEGQVLSDASVGKGELKIEGYICEDLEENRRRLIRICTRQEGFTIVDGEYAMDAVLKRGVELSYEKRFKEKLLKFTIHMIAPCPFWRKSEKISQLFYNCGGYSNDSNAIFITNDGDVDTGFEARLLMATSATAVTLSCNGEQLVIEYSPSLGDTIYIDTRRGKKSVMLQKSGQAEKISILEYVKPSSSFFSLRSGENRIDYIILQGVARITIDYTPIYMR